MTTALTVLIVIIAGLILAGLYVLQRRQVKFSKQVFLALGLGIVFGLILQLSFGATSKIITNAIDWLNIVGGGLRGIAANADHAADFRFTGWRIY